VHIMWFKQMWVINAVKLLLELLFVATALPILWIFGVCVFGILTMYDFVFWIKDGLLSNKRRKI